MSGVDKKIMTKEAIALRGGENVTIEGVNAKVAEHDKLSVTLPESMSGEQLQKWLERNAAKIGYSPIDRGVVQEARTQRKPVKNDDDFEPLQPYTEA